MNHPRVQTMAEKIEYKNYTIEPLPDYAYPFRFRFFHKDYDGPEDKRTGIGQTMSECQAEIDIMEKDNG